MDGVADLSEKNASWQGGTSISAEDNKALVRRFMEARAKADLDAIEEMMAPDFISHGLLPVQQPGREGYKRQVAKSGSALSDVRFAIEDQVAAGDKVTSRISGRATHDRKEIWRSTYRQGGALHRHPPPPHIPRPRCRRAGSG